MAKVMMMLVLEAGDPPETEVELPNKQGTLSLDNGRILVDPPNICPAPPPEPEPDPAP